MPHQAHTCQELLELELGHWSLSWDSGFGGGVARLEAGSPTPGSASLSWFEQSVPLSVRPAGLGDLCPVPCELPEPGTLTARPSHQATWPRLSWSDDSPAVGAHQGLLGWGKLFPPGARSESPAPQNLANIPCGALGLLILGINSLPDGASPELRPSARGGSQAS